jgi:hypothetical protein
MVINPLHKLIRDSGRGCSLSALSQPSGVSGFVDDTNLHADGPDAIPAMQILVGITGGYCRWAGILVNMLKSLITAIDFTTGKQVSTDSITLDGCPFPAVPPGCAHKHLGIRIALTGDTRAEKAYVIEEMQRRLEALREDSVLSPSQKEMVIKIGVVPVFGYSAVLVP